jgi:plastocyanin
MRSRPLLPTLLAALLLVLAACTTDGGGTTAEASASEAASAAASEGGATGNEVTIVGFAYEPTELTVSVGDTVRFVNENTATHTVTEGSNGSADDDAAFDEQIASGESVEITFDEAGDINVTCRFHANMNMVVHVE